MSSSTLSSRATSRDATAVSQPRHAWQRFKPLAWLSPFALFFYLFQLAPMVWVGVNSFKVDDE
ncbi:ABC transporter permease, partial [Vibrio fluvialis]|nr:ABC transporter permease [Vibrio fluvialis]